MNAAMTVLQKSLECSQAEIKALREEVLRARNESLIESLTDLANRRAFDQQLAVCVAVAQIGLSAQTLCLVTADIDHFKPVNDTYSHSFGDQVLRAVAQLLKACSGQHHIAARTGGEEFAILLPQVALPDANTLVEKIRSAVSRSHIRRQGAEETLAKVTLSLGVTLYRMGEEVGKFLDRADRALYASKSGGRERVTVMAT